MLTQRTHARSTWAAVAVLSATFSLAAAAAAEPFHDANTAPASNTAPAAASADADGFVRIRGGSAITDSAVTPVGWNFFNRTASAESGCDTPAAAKPAAADCAAGHQCAVPRGPAPAAAGCAPGSPCAGGCPDGTCSTGVPCESCPSCEFAGPAHIHPYIFTLGDLERWHRYRKARIKEWFDARKDCEAEGGWYRSKCWWEEQKLMWKLRNRQQSANLNAHLHAKMAYFIPSGCGGGGCPPVGMYKVVYPVNPWAIDSRDTQVYADPATGIPIVVPLPPNVEHVMNYSDNTPSSRLTRLGYRTYPR